MTAQGPTPCRGSAQPPLRVVQLILSDKFAGAEQHVALLSRELAARGIYVRLVCGDRNARLADAMQHSGVHVSAVRLGRGNLPADWIAAYHAVAHVRPHIIHAHLGNSLLVGASVAPLTRARGHLFFTQHFVRSAYLGARGPQAMARSLAHRVVHRQVALALAMTRVARDTMIEHEGFDPARTAIMPLGIDVADVVERSHAGRSALGAELGLPSDALVILTPARLEAEKGHATLLAALPAVVRHHPNVYLLLAGTGARLDVLTAQTGRLKLEHHVRFLGYRSDVPALLRQAALCVLPSYEEPFGLVLLEAMAVGTPVIACNAGGPRDIVRHGETGLLVAPRDSQALATAIVGMLDAPSQARAMAEAAKRRVQECYSAARMTEQMVELYRRVSCRQDRAAEGRD